MILGYGIGGPDDPPKDQVKTWQKALEELERLATVSAWRTKVKDAIAEVVKQHTKGDPRYLQTHAVDEIVSAYFSMAAFVLIEQIDAEHLGGIANPEYRWSVWLMKQGEAAFTRVYEDHAYESEREVFLRLVYAGNGKLQACNENGDEVWSYNPTKENAQ
jgi:hypothetical protein